MVISGANHGFKEGYEMIGCMILGTFLAFGAARLIRHRYGCLARYGGHGGCGPAWGHGHHGHGQGHAFGPPWNEGWGGREGGFGGGGGFGDDEHRGGPGGGFVMRSVLGHIRATATQEKVVRAAFDEFRQEIKEAAGGEGKRTRQDVGAALRKPHFDEVFMGELFARQDTAIERTRKAFVGLMAKVHDVLDEEQRGRLAELAEKGPRFWRRGFGW